MSLTISQILNAIAPQFITDATRSDHITLAELRTNRDCFNDKYNYAVALRAAHTLTLKDIQGGAGGGSSGMISSKREGDLAISFSNQMNQGDDSYLGLTSYGKDLQALINGSIMGIQITGLQVNCDGSTLFPEALP